jgi:hypothetical protein
MGWILLIFLLFLLVGALPRWGFSRRWSYWPSSMVGFLLLLLFLALIFGAI